MLVLKIIFRYSEHSLHTIPLTDVEYLLRSMALFTNVKMYIFLIGIFHVKMQEQIHRQFHLASFKSQEMVGSSLMVLSLLLVVASHFSNEENALAGMHLM